MSAAESISLLGFANTPILVGDPEGRIVYANPTFRRSFCPDSEDVLGLPIAMVFGGGAREAVLSVTAAVLERGETARVQIREGGIGYNGVASPIEAEDDRVGVIMVLLQERASAEIVPLLVEEVGEPISRAIKSFQVARTDFEAQPDSVASRAFSTGLRALDEAQRAHRELNHVVRGGKLRQGRFDVAEAIKRVADRTAGGAASEETFQMLIPTNLPEVVGTESSFERLMGQLLRQRMNESKDGEPLTLLARSLGSDDATSVLVSLVDVPEPSRRESTGLPPDALAQGISAMGGETICVEDSTIGRVTSMRFAVAGS